MMMMMMMMNVHAPVILILPSFHTNEITNKTLLTDKLGPVFTGYIWGGMRWQKKQEHKGTMYKGEKKKSEASDEDHKMTD